MLPSRILNTLGAVSLLLAFLAGSAAAQSERAEIQSLLEQRDAEIKRLLGPNGAEVPDARKEQLRDVVNGFLDFGSMAREALGTHWDDLSEAQRTEFVDVFADIVRGQSLSDLDPYRAIVAYESISVDGQSARVLTRTVLDEVPMAVEYRLRKIGDDWMATDIILDEVSTVEGYSRSFRSMIRKRGFDTLMERLQKRRDEMATD